jgi:3-oxoacyl-[acyl-carrier-protein] synthase-3
MTVSSTPGHVLPAVCADLLSEQVVSNLAEYGNTSAASIPLALDEAVRDGKVKPGDVVAMAGFGAGLTWAGAIVRWG